MGILKALGKLVDDDYNTDFTLHNETGYDIYEVYVSASDDDDWGEDVMDEDVLEDGESVAITFDSTSESRYWDIRVVDEDDDEAVFERIDLGAATDVTLYYDEDGDPCARWE